MDGEFKVQLKQYNQDVITKLFKTAYQDKLKAAYAKSAYRDSTIFSETDFCAGSFANGTLLLVYTLEADNLKFYVETENKEDIKVMKKAINDYFRQATRILSKNNIKWSHPEATITLDKCPFFGTVKTLRKRVTEVFDKEWQKLIIAPIASVLSSYVAIQFNILKADDSIQDIKKAVTLTFEAYIGLVMVLSVQVLFRGKRNEFTFNI